MKLEKAKEILTDLVRDQPTFSPDDRREAVKLGIEAMKQIRNHREYGYFAPIPLLPGETKE